MHRQIHKQIAYTQISPQKKEEKKAYTEDDNLWYDTLTHCPMVTFQNVLHPVTSIYIRLRSPMEKWLLATLLRMMLAVSTGDSTPPSTPWSAITIAMDPSPSSENVEAPGGGTYQHQHNWSRLSGNQRGINVFEFKHRRNVRRFHTISSWYQTALSSKEQFTKRFGAISRSITIIIIDIKKSSSTSCVL